jgi:hypothetical protein
MPTMLPDMPHLSIDGKWVPCLPAEEYGFIGFRSLCDLGSSPDQPQKKLLIRRLNWTDSGAPENGESIDLTTVENPRAANLGLRHIVAKSYPQATARGEGKIFKKKDSCRVYQQDITGLISLKRAVLRVLNEGTPGKVWQLFYAACRSLREFGQTFQGAGQVPLQLPSSLAVGKDNRVVPLDAEFQIPPFSTESEIAKQYGGWFNGHVLGFAPPEMASLLHSRALLVYFRDLLNQAGGKNPEAAKIADRLNSFAPEADLRQLEGEIQGTAQDWNIYINDEDFPREARPMEVSVEQYHPPRKQRSILVPFLMLVNLALVALIVYLLLYPSGSFSGSGGSAIDTSLLFSSYCVVFPTQGTSGEKVHSALKELFKGEIIVVQQIDPKKKLREKLEELQKEFAEPEKLQELLILLQDSSLRFKNFEPGDAKEGIRAIIERGGIFSITSGEMTGHGSLLQFSGLEKVLKQGDKLGDQAARNLLGMLKKAVAEYASLSDALSIAGDRQAFILRVEPTAAAHEEVRKKLLSRLERPVFISRPVLELFDAVDPTGGGGGGQAEFSLIVESYKSFWRLVGKDDRKNVDFESTSDTSRMKWKAFEPNKVISWTPISVTKKNGSTRLVTSFDIGVLVNKKKVVVFRNQSIILGASKQDIKKQAQTYLNKALGLKNIDIGDSVKVVLQGGKDKSNLFAGALLYGYLAEQVTDANLCDDLEIFDLNGFLQKQKAEDDF